MNSLSATYVSNSQLFIEIESCLSVLNPSYVLLAMIVPELRRLNCDGEVNGKHSIMVLDIDYIAGTCIDNPRIKGIQQASEHKALHNIRSHI